MSAPPRHGAPGVPPAAAPSPVPPILDFPRLRVGIVGAGRVGTVLGAALARAGHRIVAVSATSAASRDRAARLLPGVPVLPPAVVTARTDLLLLAVPDDVLAGLAASLPVRPGQLVAHTSGAHGLAVLAPVEQAGALPLALHPAMTFTGAAGDLDRLAGISYGVTAPGHLKDVAEQLVTELGGTAEWIPEAARPLYHAALAHGANHLVTLVAEAADLLRDAGVVHPEQVLRPLLTAALDNALRLGDAALTGPVSRGDAGTVAAHLDAVRAVAPDAVAAYLALARRTADRATHAGRLPPTTAAPLREVLDTGATTHAGTR